VTFVPKRMIVTLRPFTPEWTAEIERKKAVGEPVSLMQKRANEGIGWTVEDRGSGA
jgi:hypothetical protein